MCVCWMPQNSAHWPMYVPTSSGGEAQVVDLSRDRVLLARELRDPEAVDHVVGGEPDRRSAGPPGGRSRWRSRSRRRGTYTRHHQSSPVTSMRNSSCAGLRSALVVETVTTASTARINIGTNTPPIQMNALSERLRRLVAAPPAPRRRVQDETGDDDVDARWPDRTSTTTRPRCGALPNPSDRRSSCRSHNRSRAGRCPTAIEDDADARARASRAVPVRRPDRLGEVGLRDDEPLVVDRERKLRERTGRRTEHGVRAGEHVERGLVARAQQLVARCASYSPTGTARVRADLRVADQSVRASTSRARPGGPTRRGRRA